MAADRQRLAQALAAEAARRRLFESIPEAAGQGLPQAPEATNYGRDLENLSIGLGRGAVNQLEGLKGLVTSPVESVKGIVSGVGEAIRNPRMIAEALQRTGKRAASGPLGLGEVVGENFNMARVPSAKPVMSEINVYHGSPHKFDAFDASKIGTGEGAQAYGHGIYLAESPDVAQHYSTGGGGFVPVQGKNNVYFNGQWVQDFSDKKSPEGLAKYAMSQLSTGTTIKEKAETLNKIGRKDAADWLEKNADKFNQSKGNLYTADLPDQMVERMLDWDKPLTEQPPSVQYLLSKLDPDSYYPQGIDYAPEELGQMIYARLANSPKAKTQAEASAVLKAAGIPGIRYLDAGSRGQGGTGTRNFVVFPGEETKVKILKRE